MIFFGVNFSDCLSIREKRESRIRVYFFGAYFSGWAWRLAARARSRPVARQVAGIEARCAPGIATRTEFLCRDVITLRPINRARAARLARPAALPISSAGSTA